jgi:hypothetical protein
MDPASSSFRGSQGGTSLDLPNISATVKEATADAEITNVMLRGGLAEYSLPQESSWWGLYSC